MDIRCQPPCDTSDGEEGNEKRSDADSSERPAPVSVSPVDPAEAKLARQIDHSQVQAREPEFSYGAKSCDFCQTLLSSRGLFVDGMTNDNRNWANMCVPCFTTNGVSIGWGKGQLYARQPNGGWRLVAGFRPT